MTAIRLPPHPPARARQSAGNGVRIRVVRVVVNRSAAPGQNHAAMVRRLHFGDATRRCSPRDAERARGGDRRKEILEIVTARKRQLERMTVPSKRVPNSPRSTIFVREFGIVIDAIRDLASAKVAADVHHVFVSTLRTTIPSAPDSPAAPFRLGDLPRCAEELDVNRPMFV